MSGRGGREVCKTNRLVGVLDGKINQNLRDKARDGRMRGESASEMKTALKKFKRELKGVKKQKSCIGGAKSEDQQVD